MKIRDGTTQFLEKIVRKLKEGGLSRRDALMLYRIATRIDELEFENEKIKKTNKNLAKLANTLLEWASKLSKAGFADPGIADKIDDFLSKGKNL